MLCLDQVRTKGGFSGFPMEVTRLLLARFFGRPVSTPDTEASDENLTLLGLTDLNEGSN